MASVQCQKSSEERYQQEKQHGSFGQKISEFFKGHQNHDHSNEGTKTHTQYYSQTEVLSQSGHLTSKTQTQTQCSCSHTDTKDQGRNTKQHNKNLFQKIKDGLSGHSSESDSDSDNKNYHKSKG